MQRAKLESANCRSSAPEQGPFELSPCGLIRQPRCPGTPLHHTQHPQQNSMVDRVNLLDLPNELLDEIGRYGDRNDSLSISLACCRLQRVGQEQLIRTSPVCPSNIWRLANTLRDRPDLVKAYSNLRIGSLYPKVCYAIDDYLSRQQANAEMKCYMDIVSQRFPSFTITTEGARRIVAVRNFIQLGFMVLLALCPTICALEVSMNVLDAVGNLLGFCHRSATFSRIREEEEWALQVRDRFESGLERLVVFRDKHMNDPVPQNRGEPPLLLSGRERVSGTSKEEILDTSRCKRLVTLQAPCRRLAPTRARTTSMLLPRSLKTLCMNVPANDSVDWRAQVDVLIANAGKWPCLHVVDLRFQYNTISSAWNLCRNREQGRRDLTRFKGWRSCPFRLITTFGNKKCSLEEEPGTFM